MTRAVEARISASAIRHNLDQVKRAAPGASVMAMVKANGYGHGLERVAQTLDRADAFGVACLEEAEQIRAAGITKPVVLLGGFFSPDELDRASQLDLDLAVHHVDQLQVLEQRRLSKPVRVWLKIDSGMHRLGIAANQVSDVWRRLEACANVARPLRAMSHFASADEPDNQQTRQQIQLFDSSVAQFKVEKSLANSAAILAFPESHHEWVRPGLMLYGASPFADRTASQLGLQPAMTLSAPVMVVNQARKGDAIGYGGAYICPRDMPIGIIAIGYGDGYPRHAKTGTPVLLNGDRVPLVGRVSMDSIFVDLSGCPSVRSGDRATLWGKGLPIEEIARFSDTIPYELMCKLTSRVRFYYQ